MQKLVVGIGELSLYIRQASSLKDKRQVERSLRQKLHNLGFSVCEYADADKPKILKLGFCVAGRNHRHIEEQLASAKQLFFGNFEVISQSTDVVTYEPEISFNPNDEKYGEE